MPANRTAGERAAYAAGIGVLVLHAATDAFLAPEPGTRWSDHLLPGLVTIGVLAAAAALLTRLGAGGRAAIAAALGVLALEGSALAISDSRAVRARGEDWTGFLLAPAGVAFLAVAFVVLWRSRKPGGRRWLRRGGIGLATVVATYWVVLPIGVAILATHRPRADVTPPSLGRPYEAVTIHTADGLALAGWYVRSRNGAAVISYPTRQGKVPHARMLVRHGYGVLLLDPRGQGSSEGDTVRWAGDRDLLAAAEYLRGRPDVDRDRIGGFGFSIGGEMLLEAAAQSARFQAIVSEGAGSRVGDEDVSGPTRVLAEPNLAVMTAGMTVFSNHGPPPPIVERIRRIAPRPVFLIYAEHGIGGENLRQPKYFAAAGKPKSIWMIPGSKHTGGIDARPAEYERRVVAFFDRAFATRNTKKGNSR